MILSKQNLQIYSIPQNDAGIPVLNNVHITKEGASIAANSKTVIVVSPVTDTIKKSLPLQDEEKFSDEFTISIGLAKEICNAMPVDTAFGGLTEHVLINKATDNELQFQTTDGKRKKSLLGKKFERKYIEITQENELILRSLNPRTGQHVAAFMSSFSQQEEGWIDNDQWEKQFVDIARIQK